MRIDTKCSCGEESTEHLLKNKLHKNCEYAVCIWDESDNFILYFRIGDKFLQYSTYESYLHIKLLDENFKKINFEYCFDQIKTFDEILNVMREIKNNIIFI